MIPIVSVRALKLTLFFAVVAFCAPAGAATISIATDNSAGWSMSSVVDVYDSSPWPGSTLPNASTFTLTPSFGGSAAGNGIYAGSGVQYFQNSFSLPSFGSISGTLMTRADNNMEVFVNGVELAIYGTDLCGFCQGDFALSVATDGTVSNGAGGTAFSYTLGNLPSSAWISGGTNVIQVAVRNLSGGDSGGLVLSFNLTTSGDAAPTATPEPVSLGLLAVGLAGLGVVRRKRG